MAKKRVFMSIRIFNMKNPSNAIIASYLKNHFPDVYETIIKRCGEQLVFTQESVNKIWSLCELDQDRTRLVIAVSLILYSPQTMNGNVRVKKGLVTTLCQYKGTTPSAISQMIPSVIQWYKSYADFKVRTDLLVNAIKNKQNDKAA